MIAMDYQVLLYTDEDGYYVAECLDLQGCISGGKTKKDALENIKEAIQGYNESIVKEKLEKQKGKLVKVTI